MAPMSRTFLKGVTTGAFMGWVMMMMGYHLLGALVPLTKSGQCKEGADLCKHWKAYAKSSYALGFLFYLP